MTRLRAGPSEVRIRTDEKRLFFSRPYRTSSMVLLGSYSVGTWRLFLEGGAWVWALRLTIHLHLMLRLRMSGSIPPLPLYEFLACITTALPITYSRQRDPPSFTRSSHMLDVLRSSHKTSCNLFVLFKGCLGRIHENGHLSSSDCSCYDFQKNCSRIRYEVQNILWLLHDSYKCKTLVTKICSCDSWGNTAPSCKLSCKFLAYVPIFIHRFHLRKPAFEMGRQRMSVVAFNMLSARLFIPPPSLSPSLSLVYYPLVAAVWLHRAGGIWGTRLTLRKTLDVIPKIAEWRVHITVNL